MKKEFKASGKNKKNLYEILENLPDIRRAQGRRHRIEIVLITAIMAIMSGCYGKDAMGDFAKRNKKDLVKIFKLKKKEKRVPSNSTFWRVLKEINFEELAQAFYEWAKGYVKIEEKDWLSIDGKAIRGTIHSVNKKHQNFVSLVTVFSQKRKQVIAANKVEKTKDNEYKSVEELIEILDLKGVIFTLDALHCQKNTVKKIKETGNDYLIATKNNQPKLYKQLKKT